ncbi:MAG TPA: S-layer homology domain-containing protein [Blastocatellia bacterium]|nr:S-layer homology domain-containing protein [Blastocatellia bacterium]
MRKELMRVIFIAASLAVVLITLSSQTAANLTTGAGQPRQSSATWSPDQQVVARVTVGRKQGLEALIATGVNLLEGRKGQDVFVLTTVAKVEELRQQGWPLTMLFVRGLDADTWQHVEAPLGGGCTFSLDPTYLSVTALGGNFSFALNTSDPSCEWTVFSSESWLHVNGPGQGTGSTTVFYGVDANPTSSNRVGFIFAADQFFTLYQGVQYNDVAVGSLFYEEIEKLSARGVTVGCGNGNYCPNDLVPREQMAAFIMRAKGEFNPPTPASQRFNDVPPDNVFYNFIDRLAELGITVGCQAAPPLYCPSDPVKRDQMAAFIIRGLGEFNPPTPASQRFADVPPSNPFYNFIERMGALGITQGCGGPNYCPSLSVTRAQMAAFLVRAFNL